MRKTVTVKGLRLSKGNVRIEAKSEDGEVFVRVILPAEAFHVPPSLGSEFEVETSLFPEVPA